MNTRFLLENKLEGYGYFTKEVFKRLCQQHSEHQFYFIFDRPFNKEFIFAENVIPVIASPPARHPLLWKFWYDVKVPGVLKKIKADVFVSPDGFCSLFTSVPQCLVIHDLGFLHHSEGYKKSHLLFYKRYTPKFLKKAKTIATVSEFSKSDIVHQYKIEKDRIRIVYSAAKEAFSPLEQESHSCVKEKYSNGKDYFICVGAIHSRKNLLNLLRALSIFKKMQKSNMKLLLVGRLNWKNNDFIELLNTYKYRGDVVLLGYVQEEELVKLVAAAYALIYPSFFEGFGVPVLEAMLCHVPVLTSGNTSMKEIAENAALYFDPYNVNDIADKMMLIYKSENLRRDLIEKGKQVVKKYHWQRTADLLWQSIMEAVT
ncbi:MAG: glycosyltransferase family 4 protein [Chitinophagaceae bacterium]|nr:glycosyltransferase family 4 protein [Chitinophagaceae bacterium]